MLNVLILTDNPFIYRNIHKIIEIRNKENLNVHFCRSNVSNNIENLPAEGIDVKKEFNLLYDKYDLIISAHCKQIFPGKLVENVRCINIHPGYNPVNRGWYPQVFAILHDLPIGATIHEMTNDLDHGPIIAREKIEKYSWDTSETLYNRVLNKEIELFDNNFESIMDNNYNKIVPENEGNIFSKKDFKSLLHIDLDEKVTYADAIKRLRAVSHGNYKNAYFISPEGEKVYVNIVLSKSDE